MSKKKFSFDKYFKTSKRLNIALENISNIEGFEEYLICCELMSMLDVSYDEAEKVYLDEIEVIEIPEHFVDSAYNPNKPEEEYTEALKNGSVYVQWVEGIHEPYDYGDVLEIDQENSSNKHFKYINSIKLDEVKELQAEDGEFCYYYIGNHFLRVLTPVYYLSH